jgi:S1-C subfamily serine protease
VTPDGFASDAGVAVGDLLLYLDGEPIYRRTDLWPFQRSRKPGEQLEVEYARDGKALRGTGTLRPVTSG